MTTETKTRADSIQPLLERLDACGDARKWARQRTLAEAWSECPRGDWLLWLAGRLGIDRRVLVAATCAVVRPALRYVPAGEDRPRLAIEAAEAGARGEEGVTLERVRWAAADAYDAAADAYDAAAYATEAAAYAAYAAAYATEAAAYAADAAAEAASDDDADDAGPDAAAGTDARVASLAASADLVRQHIPSHYIDALAAEVEAE